MSASTNASDMAVMAFRRLLGETTADTQARVDALMAFCQRQVWVATWAGQEEPRVVTNSAGETALAVFTGMDTLEAAAGRLGFRGHDGEVSTRQLSVREALRHALARSVHFLVVDPGASHMMEFARGEFEPLLNAPSQRGTSGPYAASKEAEESLWRAVRSSSHPPAAGRGSFYPKAAGEDLADDAMGGEPSTGVRKAEMPETVLSGRADDTERYDDTERALDLSMPFTEPATPTTPLQTPMPEADAALEDDVHTRPTLVGGPSPDDTAPFDTVGSSAADQERSERTTIPSIPAEHLRAAASRTPRVLAPLEDEVLDAFSHAMRDYPEIEWASAWVDADEGHCLGVRVDPAFLTRVAEISDRVTRVAEEHGIELSVVILHTKDEVLSARQRGTVIFPGRTRAMLR